MSIALQKRHSQAMQTHAENSYPHECCGLLIGQLSGDNKTLIEVLPVENSWDEATADEFRDVAGSAELGKTRRERYAIAPKTLLEVQKQARDRQLNIIGIYHSHPDHPAVPSAFDEAIAWQQYSYIIISVRQGNAADLRSWTLDNQHHFQLEKILNIAPT